MKEPLVSISILNWNGKEMTVECLESLKKLKYKNYEVIVVDNGSDDGSVEFLKKIPGIKLVTHKENLGFTGGHNAAYKIMKGKYICLFNNDMVADPMWLTRLVEVLEKDPKAGACAGGRFDWNEKNPAYNQKNILRTIKHLNKYIGFPWEENYRENLENCDTITAGAVLIRKSVLDKIGFFDDDFFAYAEDRDLFARMKRAGYKTMFVPKAYIWHKISATGKRNKYKFYFLTYRNHIYFLYKNFDSGYLQLALLRYLFRETKNNLKEIIVNDRDKNLEKARWDVFKWYFKNLKKLRRKRKESQKMFPNVKFNKLIGNVRQPRSKN